MVIDFNRPNGPTPASSSRSNSASSTASDIRKTASADTTKPENKQVNNDADDSVRLSPEAQQLKAASERMRNLPNVDSERVASLKQAISEGSYNIDSKRIASKLLAFESQR